METNNGNEPPQRTPFGIALIILILVFWIIGSLFSIFSSPHYFDISRSGGNYILIDITQIVCPAAVIYGFLMRRNWSRLLFIFAAFIQSVVGFAELQDIIKDIDLSKYNAEELGYAAEYFLLVKTLYIVIFAAAIIYIFRKKPYFNGQGKNAAAKPPGQN